MAKGKAGDIRAGGAYIELYDKGVKEVEAGLKLAAVRADRFTRVLATMSKASRAAFGATASASKAMGAAVSKSIGVAVKATKALNTQMTALMLGARRVLPGIASSFSKFGRSAAMIGGVGSIAGIFSGITYAGFQQEMQRVLAVSQATEEEFAKLTSMAKHLGATTEFTASQAASGFAFLSMAGLKAADQLEVLPVVLDVATAAAIDLGEAADIITDVGTAFGIYGGNVIRVADVMAQAAANSNTNIQMMGETFKYLAPMANAAGQSIEEMGAAVGLVAGSGIKASTAGTGVREAIINLAVGSKTRKLKSATGIDAADEAGNIKPLLDIIKELKASMADMPNNRRLELMTQIFGKRGGNVVLALMSRTNEELDEMRKKMNNAAGAASKMAGIMRDSVMGSWKGFVSAVESVQIEIGEAIAPLLRKTLDELAAVVRKASAWIKENKEVAVSYAVIAASITGAGLAAMALGAALSTVATIMTPLTIAATGLVIGVGAATSTAIGMIGAAMTAAVTVVASLPGIAAGAVTAITSVAGLTASVLGSAVSAIIGIPVLIKGTIIAAVGAFRMLKAAVIVANTAFYASIKVAWAAIKIIGVAMKTISAAFGIIALKIKIAKVSIEMFGIATVAASIAADVSKSFISMAASLLTVVASIKAAIIGAVAQIIAFLPGILIVGSAIAGLVVVGYSVYNSLKQISAVAVNTAKAAASAIYNITSAIGKAFVGVFSAIGKGFGTIASAISRNMDTIKKSVSGFMESAIQAGKELYESFSLVMGLLTKGKFQEAMNIVWAEIQLRISDAKILAMKAVKTLLENLPAIVSVLSEAFSVIVSELKSVFSGLWIEIRDQIEYLFAHFKKAWQVILNQVGLSHEQGIIAADQNIHNIAIRQATKWASNNGVELGSMSREDRKKLYENWGDTSVRSEMLQKYGSQVDEQKKTNSLLDGIMTKIDDIDIVGGLAESIENESKRNSDMRSGRQSAVEQGRTALGASTYSPWTMREDRALTPEEREKRSRREKLRFEYSKTINAYESANEKGASGVPSKLDYAFAKRAIAGLDKIQSQEESTAAERAAYEKRMNDRRNGIAAPDKIDQSQAKINQVAATDYRAQITGRTSKGTFNAFEAAAGFSGNDRFMSEAEAQTDLLRQIAENTEEFAVVG